jgi:hypothetical protein
MPDNFLGDAWVVIRPDISKFEAELAAGVTDSLAKVQAMANAKPIRFRVEVDTSAALAQMAGLKAAMAASGGVGGGGGGGVGGVVPLPVPGGGGGGGLLSTIGFGRAAGIAGMAGAFSLASFAGLGFEHVLTTAIGLAGSLAGAIGGGLLLAIGAVGVAAVGMGSDLAVMKSTIADTKTLYTGLTALRQAIIQYGAGSAQAVAAQTALNVQVQMLGNTAGVAAEMALAKSVQAMNIFWDKATSGARVAAVGILQQFVTLANTYIPLVADAAQRNFIIIGNAIKPLMAWLGGPATVIFKHLEDVFAKTLPVAVHAFTQGIELLLKSINFLSNYTGGLTRAIDDFLTKANSPAGFLKWQGIMEKLIAMFHTWWGFVKELAKVIYDLFSQSLGLGTAIVTTITGMLVKLDAWLLSSSGKNAVHTLFAVHLQEVLALLALLPTLLGAFSHLYLAIAPPLTVIVTGLALMVGWMVQVPVAGPILAWGLAIAFLVSKLKLLALASIIGDMYAFAAACLTFATSGAIAGSVATALGVALATPAVVIGAIVVAIAAIAVGIVLLITHFQQVKDWMGKAWGAVETFFKDLPARIGQAVGNIVQFFHDLPGRILTALGDAAKTLLKWAGDAIHGLVAGVTTAWPTVSKWFGSLPGLILTALGNAALWLLKTGASAIGGLLLGLVQSLPNTLKFFIELPFRILALVITAAKWLWQTGTEVLSGLVKGLIGALPSVGRFFHDLPGHIWDAVSGAGIWLWNTGWDIIHGLHNGLIRRIVDVWHWFTGLPGELARNVATCGKWLWDTGWNIIQGLWNGLTRKWQDVVNWFKGIGSDIAGFVKGALGMNSPSQVFHDIGTNIMQGLHNGLKSGMPPILNALTGFAGSMSGSLVGGGTLRLSGGAGGSGSGSTTFGGPPGGTVTINQTINANGANRVDVEDAVQRGNRQLMREVVLALRAR